MSLPERMQRRKRDDQELERQLAIRKHDPVGKAIGRTYTPADIEALEEERLPWLKELRRRAREHAR